MIGPTLAGRNGHNQNASGLDPAGLLGIVTVLCTGVYNSHVQQLMPWSHVDQFLPWHIIGVCGKPWI